ncbi:T9SS type A sorting domain-containing protein [Algibacter sp. 2305UL17-15]|uniref:T9SS type A sorting domain-containing protein n=1 Tax=Algibacter sp. 2305UL17-15 TaxID=3231268 RepID=UPI0034577EAE
MKTERLKILVFLMLGICSGLSIQAQNESNKTAYRIIRSNLGVGGSSKIIATSKGQYRVSQSIGQSSVIGTSSRNGYYLRQGFQQPHKRIKIVKNSINNSLNATVYPNPFGDEIAIAFNETIEKELTVLVYDVSGKLIYTRAFSPAKHIQLDLKHLSSGSYLLKAISNGKLFNSKLIKI